MLYRNFNFLEKCKTGLAIVTGCGVMAFSAAGQPVGPSAAVLPPPAHNDTPTNAISPSEASGNVTNTIVTRIQVELESVLQTVELTTVQVAKATHGDPTAQEKAVLALAEKIEELAKGKLSDKAPLVAETDALISKDAAQIRLAQDRSGDPQLSSEMQGRYGRSLPKLKENVQKVRAAREAVSGVRADLLMRAHDLREMKDYLAFVAEAETNEAAGEAFIACLNRIHDFCRRLSSTLTSFDGQRAVIVE